MAKITSESSVHVGKLGKVPCANCGKEVNLLRRVQLADYSELCKDCLKKTAPVFAEDRSTIEDYKASFKQLEDGQKLFDKYFNKNKDAKVIYKQNFYSKTLWINESAGLMAVVSKRGGFMMFGGTNYYLVYRLADIESLVDEKVVKKNSNGAPATFHYASFVMHNVAGIGIFRIYSKGKYGKIKKAIDKAMGLTGIKGLKNSFTSGMAKATAVADMVSAAKDALSNKDDEFAAQNAAENIQGQMEDFFYVGRETLVEKADNAIKAVIS